MSDNQSSNTLFHFTKNSKEHPGIKNIISILEKGFEPRLCKEDLNFIFKEYKNADFLIRYIPMVCFCDIPLKNAEFHMKRYSSYGIGLKKQWGLENGISPVIYVPPIPKKINHNSLFVRLIQIIDASENLEEKYGIFGMIKPYEGKFRMRKNGKPVHFYDEREWRFLHDPPYNTLYNKWRSKKKREKFYEKLKPLEFQPSDIKYIIVSQEDEKSDIWDKIEKIEKYKPFEKKVLCSKVISAQEIQEDF